MSERSFDAVVIGGGLHGLSAALHIARRGRRTVVLERAWSGRHASGASAAGVRTLGRAVEELPLAVEASRYWHAIADLVGDHCGYHSHGQVRVAENEAEIAVLEKRAARTRELGYSHEELVDRAELRRLVPAIAPHCVAAMVVRSDGAADPHRTLRAFRAAAEAAGVTIREGAGVDAIERRGDRWAVRAAGEDWLAPALVNAAGAWAGRIAALVGDDVPLGTKASMMIVTERVGHLLDPVVSAVGWPLSFKQTDRGTLLIGGGRQGVADLDAEAATVDLVEVAVSARTACELFPAIGDIRVARVWSGLEAKTEDMIPVIGPSPNAPGVVHAFGFSGHGFQLVPAAGAVVADFVVQGRTERHVEGLSPLRIMRPGALARP